MAELEFDDERILAVQTDDGTVMTDGLIAMQVGGKWYVPIGEFFNSLAIKVDIDLVRKRVSGFLGDDEHPFLMQWQKREAEYTGKVVPVSASDVIVNVAEVLVELSFFERWLGLDIDLNLFKSMITLTSPVKLPHQLKFERDLRARLKGDGGGPSFEGYRDLKQDEAEGNGVLYDQIWTPSTGTQNDRQISALSHQGVLHSEVHEAEVKFSYGGVGKNISYDRYLLSWKKVEGEMLGPFGLKEISLLDVPVPQIDLLTDGGLGRGFYASSFGFTSDSLFDFQSFSGDLPEGWEVELYRNGQLIGRLNEGQNGRYQFDNVDVFYGVNAFEIRLYGPNGEREIQKEYRFVDGSLDKSKSFKYNLGFVELDDRSRLGTFKSILPLTPYLAFGLDASYSETEDNDVEQGFIAPSVLTSFYNILLKGTVAKGEEEPMAQLVSAKWSAPFVSLNASQSLFDKGFRPIHLASLGIGVTKRQNAKLDVMLPWNLRHLLEYDSSYRGSDVFHKSLISEWNAYLYQFYLSNRMTWDLAFSKTWNATFAGQYYLGNHAFELSTTYNKDKFLSLGSEYRWQLEREVSFKLHGRKSLINDDKSYGLGARKEFEDFYTSLQYVVDTDDNSTFILRLGYGLAVNSRTLDYESVGHAVTGGSAAFIRVFNDANADGEWQEGEKGIEGVGVTLDARALSVRSCKDGYLFVANVPTLRRVHLGVDIGSLENPLLSPTEKGISYVSKPGRVIVFDLPVIMTSEIDGIVHMGGSLTGRPAGGFKMIISNQKGLVVKSTRTQSDGFYLFDKLKPGNYRVYVDPVTTKQLGLSVTPQSIDVVVGPQGEYYSDKDFTISR